MTKYNSLNVKLSNPQLNKLKSGIKNGTEVTFHQIQLEILMMKLIVSSANIEFSEYKFSKMTLHYKYLQESHQ